MIQKNAKMINETYFRNRATVRKFTDNEIDDSTLTAMLEAATHAPTTGNMQLYSVIITRDHERKSLIAAAHFNQPAATGAKILLTFCADFNRFIKWCEARNAAHGYDNFQAWMWAVEDTVIFAQQFTTIAEMNGLGTCYLGTTTYNAPQIARTLGLPKFVVPVMTVALGVPAQAAIPSDRLPIEAIIHHETYTDYDTESIDTLYSHKEELDENKHFVAENGKQNLAQVFTDIRYTRKDNEHFSKIYFDFIKEQGF